jgi:hypothetical protein
VVKIGKTFTTLWKKRGKSFTTLLEKSVVKVLPRFFQSVVKPRFYHHAF